MAERDSGQAKGAAGTESSLRLLLTWITRVVGSQDCGGGVGGVEVGRTAQARGQSSSAPLASTDVRTQWLVLSKMAIAHQLPGQSQRRHPWDPASIRELHLTKRCPLMLLLCQSPLHISVFPPHCPALVQPASAVPDYPTGLPASVFPCLYHSIPCITTRQCCLGYYPSVPHSKSSRAPCQQLTPWPGIQDLQLHVRLIVPPTPASAASSPGLGWSTGRLSTCAC